MFAAHIFRPVTGLFFVLFSILPMLVGFAVVWWLITTLNAINRNIADIARYLGRTPGWSQRLTPPLAVGSSAWCGAPNTGHTAHFGL